MNDLPLLLLIVVLAYCLFMCVTIFIGTLLFPVLKDEELDGHVTAKKVNKNT